jgi:hypothetical protein
MRTGFTSYCSAGQELFNYTTHNEALAADYRHRSAAREIAGDCFDTARVLAKMMAAVGL